ncbi:MAG: DUF3047 domain-containing protein [Alphaproteobacteria bacterium]|nr:DUF3047 domain-containing protein [Alphaproteobacteria bacterium]
MRAMRAAVTGLIVFSLAVATPATAQPVPIEVDLKASVWREITVPGRRQNDYLAVDGALAVTSDRSVSFLYAPVVVEDFAPGVRLAWRWRVDRDILPTDLAAKGKDDRALALHVWFPAADARKSRGLMRRLVAGMMGVPDWGRAITYVWGGTLPVGTMLDNPYMDGREGALIVVRDSTAPLKTWLDDAIDVFADYRRAFGGDPPPPSFVAVSSDTDDTRQSAVARIGTIRFERPPP